MSNKPADLASNRRARHDYEILETFEAGLVLKGTEIKSLRQGGGSLAESYVRLIDGEFWLVGAHIAPYSFGNIHNHPERRDRKLLLHKREMASLRKGIQEKGLTIIPLSIYLKKGYAKIKIAIARGKKLHDKRQSIKERDEKKRIDRMIKNHG